MFCVVLLGISTDLVAVHDEQLAEFLGKLADPLPLAAGGSVILGRDTRLSSPELAAAVADGVCVMGGELTDLGVVTTPQLHYVVACTNTNGMYGRPTIEGYCEKLVGALERIAAAASSREG